MVLPYSHWVIIDGYNIIETYKSIIEQLLLFILTVFVQHTSLQ